MGLFTLKQLNKSEVCANALRQNRNVLMKALNLSITASCLVGRGPAQTNRGAGPANPDQRQSHQTYRRGDEDSKGHCQ